MMFSTYDSDHDHSGYPNGCSGNFGGGWWYNGCGEANMNGDWRLREGVRMVDLSVRRAARAESHDDKGDLRRVGSNEAG